MAETAVIDLFCGIGGLSHGFKLEGFNVVAGVDADPSCQYAFETNNDAKFISEGIETVSAETLEVLYPEGARRILVGCAPCRPFSCLPTKIAKGKTEWELLTEFSRLIRELRPEVVSMENVTRMRSFQKGAVYKKFVSDLEANGYTVSAYSVYCPKYGIPQTRRRLVLFASLYGKVDLIEPIYTADKYVTLKQAIGELPKIAAGEADKEDPLHRAAALTPLNLKRIKASKPGSTWDDWDEDLRLACHTKDTGKSYRGVYGRTSWEEPGPTITTQFCGIGKGRFGHPEQDRALSLREGAILQTFPNTYKFGPDHTLVSLTSIGKHIGNAVPVQLGRVIAKSIARHIKQYYGKDNQGT